MDSTREADPELKKLGALLGAWSDMFRAPRTIKRAIQEASTSTYDVNDEALQAKRGALLEAMEDIAGDRNSINKRMLGNWISSKVNRVVNGLRFENHGTAQNFTLWSVRKM
jgi:uncharacterized protein (UPF0147 family)